MIETNRDMIRAWHADQGTETPTARAHAYALLRSILQSAAPAQVMRAVLEAFPLGEPVVVLLDNLESVMDTSSAVLASSARSA